MSQSTISQTTTVSLCKDGVNLEGNLLFSTVSSILTMGAKMIDNHQAGAVEINMSAVDKIDSAGIALLLDWKRLCDAQNKKYQLTHVSKQALSLIKTNKLEALLNLD
jgi:phospholipid transport system transporter-binding protein